ncbi:MAG TPA: MBL fold metallo-hydrolase [Xanthobacteraceae bacterium]|nr:MBL fold metallo-hydrolase [Xanthobacteraceae bacterium]
MDVTRRQTLVGATALAAAPLVGVASSTAMAMTDKTTSIDKQAPSFYRYNVGQIIVTVVSDGANTFPLQEGFVVNTPVENVRKALTDAFRPADTMTISFGPLAIKTGGKLVVVDTGMGEGAFASSEGAVGQFNTNFAAAGFDPKDVSTVVISHFHGDHINGLLRADGSPAFPNAEILVPEVEWKFFMSDEEMARANTERMKTVFGNARRVFDQGLKRKITPYAWDKEVVPGLQSISAPGHTPGHTSFVLSSGSDKVFIQSDVTNDPDLFVRNPGWHAGFDQDPELAEKTRRRVYEMLVSERMKVQGFHYPFPGVGHIEKDGAGYRLVPVQWSPNL